ncbi:hypothetical protein V5P93_002819 [Actinokineospora auranticolor]|uniref:Uncharacterized protein n=1 Tax=Actinokineospora auranticolor TaxID=155976 RepID=A0A2S6H0M9_9PSEU|nr:hypothetical protein [Actinokineospora auranticolor]PPK70960.1 hypothetical protein CLV40_101146 [Actinokineospora auranticolor]
MRAAFDRETRGPIPTSEIRIADWSKTRDTRPPGGGARVAAFLVLALLGAAAGFRFLANVSVDPALGPLWLNYLLLGVGVAAVLGATKMSGMHMFSRLLLLTGMGALPGLWLVAIVEGEYSHALAGVSLATVAMLVTAVVLLLEAEERELPRFNVFRRCFDAAEIQVGDRTSVIGD